MGLPFDAGVTDSIAALEEDRVCSVMIDAETIEEVGDNDEEDGSVNSSVESICARS